MPKEVPSIKLEKKKKKSKTIAGRLKKVHPKQREEISILKKSPKQEISRELKPISYDIEECPSLNSKY